jgi:hypothetical protein
MNEEQRQTIREKYLQAKQKSSMRFWPDVIYKDLIVSFALLLLLIGIATFIGVEPVPPADPSDTSYVAAPEWYLLFMYEMLKYFPGKIEWVGTAIIPAIGILALLLLPFYDRTPIRHWKKRKAGVTIMSVALILIIGLTVSAMINKPENEEVDLAGSITEEMLIGGDQYSIFCADCHGAEGEGGEVIGVEGLEGLVLKPINSMDEMYTRSDDTLFNIMNYGQQDLGMPPYGKAYGGELSKTELDAIVTFMRYTWDDRAEVPEDAAAAFAIPLPGPDEIPSYEIHVQPIIKRYCISCHRPGKKNNNYLMGTYEEVLTSGDNAATNITPSSLDNNTIRMLHREEIEDIGGAMPPNKPLKDEYIDVFERWILGGAPETAEDAAALMPEALPVDSNAPIENETDSGESTATP